jgi:hypothetical protein
LWIGTRIGFGFKNYVDPNLESGSGSLGGKKKKKLKRKSALESKNLFSQPEGKK